MLELEKKFPNIYKNLNENEKDLNELRFFVVIDENYEDIDDEEIDVFNPEDYNYLVYINERLSNMLTNDGLKELYLSLEKADFLENFLGSEEDLYGVKSNLNDEELGVKILELADLILKDRS